MSLDERCHKHKTVTNITSGDGQDFILRQFETETLLDLCDAAGIKFDCKPSRDAILRKIKASKHIDIECAITVSAKTDGRALI